MTETSELYAQYRSKMQLIADVRYASAVLQWDQETYMPTAGANFRGQQLSSLSEISHGLFSEEALGKLLQELLQREDLNEREKKNVELTYEDYTRNKKYTSSFVRKLSEQVNRSFHSWIEARKQNDFKRYEADLGKLVQLKKEEAALLGYEHHPYNALLNEFEKGCTVELLDRTFAHLLPTLGELLEKIRNSTPVDNSFLKKNYPRDRQWEWGMSLVKSLGFDLTAGRQDLSEHPFSTSFSSRDVRITTRVDENDFGNMTWSCIHEVGHGLYEQGLPESEYGLPLGEACSYSIHESQSRLWENNVGRGLPFWEHFYPQLQSYFPSQLEGIRAEDFFKAINKVEPSLIRTEADEITYHFHVFIRYELEKSLLDNTITTADIPSFWNEAYRKYLGINVPDDKRGCLQDVHWSHGSFGYFPTYSLGSFYAAQFYTQARLDIPGLEGQLRKGDTSQLLQWLRARLHWQGRFYTSEELCRSITGKTLDVSYFTNYLLDKYSSIYTL